MLNSSLKTFFYMWQLTWYYVMLCFDWSLKWNSSLSIRELPGIDLLISVQLLVTFFFLLLKNNDLLTISELFRKWNRCWLSQSKYRTPASTTCATVITFLVFCVYVLGQIQSLCCSTMTVILCIGVLSNLFSFEQCWKCWISPKCNKCIDGELSRGPLEINVKRT